MYKERLVVVATPESEHNLKIITEGVQYGSLFGFDSYVRLPEKDRVKAYSWYA